MTLLNREHCRCEVCDTGATYARPGDYDEELGCLWARWGSERVTQRDAREVPEPSRGLSVAPRGIWAWMRGRQ